MILVALGANLAGVEGSATQTLERTLKAFPAFGLDVVARSAWHETAAVTPTVQPSFINGVVRVRTVLSPVALMAQLHRIEAHFGRTRAQRWEARVLDLDLIDYEGLVIPPRDGWSARPAPGEAFAALPLVLPHPLVMKRGFVLAPLLEVAPDWRHPVTGQSVKSALKSLNAL